MSSYQGISLKYLYGYVRDMALKAETFGGVIHGAFVRDVVLKVQKHDFSEVKIDRVLLQFTSDNKMFEFIQSYSLDLRRIGEGNTYCLKDIHGDPVITVEIKDISNDIDVDTLRWIPSSDKLYCGGSDSVTQIVENINAKRTNLRCCKRITSDPDSPLSRYIYNMIWEKGWTVLYKNAEISCYADTNNTIVWEI